MIDVRMAKMYKFCPQNSIKSKFSRGPAPDPAGGLTAPPDPQLDFVPTNQIGWTGYFLAATALCMYVYVHMYAYMYVCMYARA